MAEILARRPEITAIATINEAALPGVQRALQRAGRDVPGRFSIAGVAGRQWAEDFHPQLTAADCPRWRWALSPSTCSSGRIAGSDAVPRRRLFAPPISLRGSTGPAPRAD